YVPLDQHLKRIVVRFYGPVWIMCGLDEFRWYSIARPNQLHGLVIDREGNPYDFGAGVRGVAIDADGLDRELAACLIITTQNMLHERSSAVGFSMMKREGFMHPRRSYPPRSPVSCAPWIAAAQRWPAIHASH